MTNHETRRVTVIRASKLQQQKEMSNETLSLRRLLNDAGRIFLTFAQFRAALRGRVDGKISQPPRAQDYSAHPISSQAGLCLFRPANFPGASASGAFSKN